MPRTAPALLRSFIAADEDEVNLSLRSRTQQESNAIGQVLFASPTTAYLRVAERFFFKNTSSSSDFIQLQVKRFD